MTWAHVQCKECKGLVPVGINENGRQVLYSHFPPRSGPGATPCPGSGNPASSLSQILRDRLQIDSINVRLWKVW